MIRLRTLAFAVHLAAAAGLAGAAACSAPTAPDGAASQADSLESELDTADWLEKASKVLRAGQGLGASDDIDALLATPKEVVVDKWMQDPRFGDAVLKFNLYYLGRAMEQVKDPVGTGGFRYKREVLAFPQAVLAAKAVLEGGNFFQLFSGAPAFLRQANGNVTPAAGADQATYIPQLDAAIALMATDRATGCANFVATGMQAAGRLSARGFTPTTQVRAWFRPTPEFPRAFDCASAAALTTEELTASMKDVRDEIDRIFAQLDARRVPAQVKSVADIPAIEAHVEGFPTLVPALGTNFFTNLPATSTNFQRKRAAHMLKTYFCDDLTPLDIAFAGGDGGAGDVHGSNPQCQACHYRLDPIGALFRDIGSRGRSFVGQPRITFDDNVSFMGEEREQYLANWRNPDGTFRAGYWILGADGKPKREPGWTDADGDTLDGFWKYLPRSKIVKSCLVRRLAEYVLGPKQVYDREWLGQISTSLADGPSSGAAFRDVVKALVLSKTFRTHDPRPGVCYDVPAGAPPNRSPCAIAHVVSTNCTGCHNSPSGFGRLDLTNWKDLGDGTFSWAHADANGQQLPRAESLRRILERITTPDRTKRMPLGRVMPQDDVATFSNWLRSQLEPSSP